MKPLDDWPETHGVGRPAALCVACEAFCWAEDLETVWGFWSEHHTHPCGIRHDIVARFQQLEHSEE